MLKIFKSQILNGLSLNSGICWNLETVKMQKQENIIHFNAVVFKNDVL